jgi:photosystem II stability/assembly factor-like uncharacterized protein
LPFFVPVCNAWFSNSVNKANAGMNKLLAIGCFVLIIAACRKTGDQPVNTTRLCFDTAFIQTPINEQLTAIQFVDAKTGFVAGVHGGIYKTNDSAKSWAALNAGTTLPIYDLFFIDSLNGFAVGGKASCYGSAGCTPPGGFVLRTKDGGQTWTNIYTPAENLEIRSVYFVNANLGFCVGKNLIFKTVDGGQNWSTYKVPSLDGELWQIRFRDRQTGYAVCNANNKILKTSDGGITWTVIAIPGIGSLNAVDVGPQAVYVAASNGIAKSVDDGATWTKLPNAPPRMRVLFFTNSQQGYALGEGNYSGGDFGYSFGAVFCTNNGGQSWDGTANMRQSMFIPAASFPVGKLGYAINLNRIVKLTGK